VLYIDAKIRFGQKHVWSRDHPVATPRTADLLTQTTMRMSLTGLGLPNEHNLIAIGEAFRAHHFTHCFFHSNASPGNVLSLQENAETTDFMSWMG
jgi:hypothetical protein